MIRTIVNSMLLIYASLQVVSCFADSHMVSMDPPVIRTLFNDYKSFYSGNRLLRIGIGFGIGAISANTGLDDDIQSWHQDDIRSSTMDDMADIFKEFGERKHLLPLTAAAAILKNVDTASPLGNWGTYSLRAYLAGSPALLLMQRTIGGSRPGETEHGAEWRPFEDNNGVSGHSFIGAVPFLTIARMNETNKPIRYLALVASTATALSRINDNAHYFSQAALGWYLAWESVDAVFDADDAEYGLRITPLTAPGLYGISAIYRW